MGLVKLIGNLFIKTRKIFSRFLKYSEYIRAKRIVKKYKDKIKPLDMWGIPYVPEKVSDAKLYTNLGMLYSPETESYTHLREFLNAEVIISNWKK